MQDAVVEALLRDYFEGEGDVTGLETLMAAAVEGGLDVSEVREWFESAVNGRGVDRRRRR